jgi:hypothetical protein
MPELVDTPFADLNIPCVHNGKTVLVALAPLCESMRLDTWTETRRLEEDQDLRDLVCTFADRPAHHEMRALPVGGLALWLDRLAEKYDDVGLRHRLAVLQREGFPSLLDHWANRCGSAPDGVDSVMLKRQFRRLQTQISTLSDALQKGATAIEQEILRAQLNQLCQFPIASRTQGSSTLERFWGTVFARMTDGAQINHARRADRFLALNFRQLASVLSDTQEPIQLTHELRTELKKSRNPYFLGVRVVNSRIARKSLRCWVFNLH